MRLGILSTLGQQAAICAFQREMKRYTLFTKAVLASELAEVAAGRDDLALVGTAQLVRSAEGVAPPKPYAGSETYTSARQS